MKDKLTVQQLRAIHAKKMYSKNGDIINALKLYHGDKNAKPQDIWNDPKIRKNIDSQADLIAKYVIEPENTSFKLLPPISFSKGESLEDRTYFPSDGNWIEKFLYKGSGKIIEMSPKEFLRLASPVGKDRYDASEYNSKIVSHLRKNMGTQAGQMPNLSVELVDGHPTITGHEGRHRAFVAMEKGISKIPVMIESGHSDKPLKLELVDAVINKSVKPQRNRYV